MRVLVVCLFSLVLGVAQGQITTPVSLQQGEWRAFLTQSNTQQFIVTDSMYYFRSDIGILCYSGIDFDYVFNFDPLFRLSSTTTYDMAVDQATERVFLAFRDGKIDYFSGGHAADEVNTILDLYITNNYADKRINDMHPEGDTLYIATNFGLLAYDLDQRETRGTYTQIHSQKEPSVSGIATLGDSLYVQIDTGIFAAPRRGENLADGASWRKVLGVDNPADDYSMVGTEDELYVLNNDTLIRYYNGQWSKLSTPGLTGTNLSNLRTNDRFAWMMTGDSVWTIKSDTIALEVNYTGLEEYALSPSGQLEGTKIYGRAGAFHPTLGVYRNPLDSLFPLLNNGRHVHVHDNQLYITPNIRSNTEPSFDITGTARFGLLDNSWTQFTLQEYGIPGNFYSQTLPLIDSRGDTWIGSYDNGVIQMRDDSVINVYDGLNSPLVGITPVDSLNGYVNVRVTDCLEDAEGNIWMTVFAASGGQGLVVHNPETKEWAVHDGAAVAYELIQDMNGYLWIRNWKSGITVYDYNGTPFNSSDDRRRRLKQGDLQGGLPNIVVNEIEMDRDGYIWAATAAGVVVFYNTFDIFTPDASTDASCPVFERRCLLEQFQVNTIAVDGANNKYYGTEDGGVYYFNEDGTEELAHFTADNSPLISDRVTDLAIDNDTGELFIATDAGVVAYQAAATQPQEAESMDALFAFPNPFKLEQHTQLTLRGASFESEVKVTTASGQLVKELTSLGGSVVWDGTDTRGNSVRSGVYLIHVLDRQGETSSISKVAVHGRR